MACLHAEEEMLLTNNKTNKRMEANYIECVSNQIKT